MKIIIMGTGEDCAADAVVLSQTGEVFAGEKIREDLCSLASLPDLTAETGKAVEKAAKLVHSMKDVQEALPGADFVLLPRDWGTDDTAIDTAEEQLRVFEKLCQDAYFVVRGKAFVGFTRRLREKGIKIINVPDISCGDVYTAMHPSHIIAGVDKNDAAAQRAAQRFAETLGVFSKNIPLQVTGEDEAETIMQFTDKYLRMQKSFQSVLSEFAAANNVDEQILKDCVQGVIEELHSHKR